MANPFATTAEDPHNSRQSRPRSRRADGEIVEVQGGHIVRSTGRKDRHSKVCTAKGPRDRRVRLSAHTAIQFYDVQDRLGFDRPSKAVDWLMRNAKAAIDELTELPPWTPSAVPPPRSRRKPDDDDTPGQPRRKEVCLDESVPDAVYGFGLGEATADTVKSFSAIGAGENAGNSIGFQDILSRGQDLCLSLQSFQDPIFRGSQSSQHRQSHVLNLSPQNDALFSGSGELPFVQDSGGWGEQSQRVGQWSLMDYAFSLPIPQAVPLHSVLGSGQVVVSQRGTLQSNNSHAVAGWTTEPAQMLMSSQHQMFHQSMPAFSGFCVPARIEGEEEHGGGACDKLPSASSGSRR